MTLGFSGRSEKNGRSGFWLAETFSTSPLKPLNGIQRNLTGSKISMSSTKFCFSGRSDKEYGCPGLWLAETILTSPLKLLNGIQRNLTGNKISMSSMKFVFFGPLRKQWPPRPLNGRDIFDFSSETAERNSTKLDSKISTSSTKFSFSGRSEKQDGRPGLWLAETFSTSPLKPLNGIQRNLTGSKISTCSNDFVFFGPIRKTRWPLWLLIGWDIFDFSSETAERNSTKLDRKQDFNVLYQVLFFGPIGKTTWLPWPLIGWDIFDFSSETAKRNSTKLDRKQDLNFLYEVCVFWADQKNKMAALAFDWLRHFRLLLWNRWTEFNETWQEARSQHALMTLCFSGRSEKQDGRSGFWLAETFSTSPLKPLNGIQRNLTGSKISMSSTKFCFSGRSEKQHGCPGLWLAETFSTSPLKPLNGIQRNLTGSKISISSMKFVFFEPTRKTRWPLWPLIGWDIFDFSSETAEQNSTKLDSKLDFNVLYQVLFFGLIGKKTWLPWSLIGWDILDFSSETAERNSTKLDRKQDLNVLYEVCVFWATPKTMAAQASEWPRHIRLLLWNRWTEFTKTWQQDLNVSTKFVFFGSIRKEK